MPLVVMKFGGTSLATIELIKKAAERVKVEVSRGYEVIVIVSAMSGKTNELIGWVNKTSSIYDAREYDIVVSSGEQITSGVNPARPNNEGSSRVEELCSISSKT